MITLKESRSRQTPITQDSLKESTICVHLSQDVSTWNVNKKNALVRYIRRSHEPNPAFFFFFFLLHMAK